jgi:hypothetical protein
MTGPRSGSGIAEGRIPGLGSIVGTARMKLAYWP